MSHDYPNIARELLKSLGGSDNLEQAAHCVTRLRLALKNPALVDAAALNVIDLVKGSFFTGGLYQVVIGPGKSKRSTPNCVTRPVWPLRPLRTLNRKAPRR